MQTRLYSDLFGLIQAMLGMSFSVVEAIRVKALVNRRAQRAYRASNYWTRFLKVGEKRDVIDGVLPYSAFGYDTVDTFLRIYLQPPYGRTGGQEFEFTVTSQVLRLSLTLWSRARCGRPTSQSSQPTTATTLVRNPTSLTSGSSISHMAYMLTTSAQRGNKTVLPLLSRS